MNLVKEILIIAVGVIVGLVIYDLAVKKLIKATFDETA